MDQALRQAERRARRVGTGALRSALGAFVILTALLGATPAAAQLVIAGADFGYVGGGVLHTEEGATGFGLRHHPRFGNYGRFGDTVIEVDWTGIFPGLLLGGWDWFPSSVRGVETGLPGQYGVLSRLFRVRAGQVFLPLDGIGLGLSLDLEAGHAGLSTDRDIGFSAFAGSATSPFTSGGGYVGAFLGPLVTLDLEWLSLSAMAEYGLAPTDVMQQPLQNHVLRLQADALVALVEGLVWLRVSALQENRWFLSVKDDAGVASRGGSLHSVEVSAGVVVNLLGPVLWLCE